MSGIHAQQNVSSPCINPLHESPCIKRAQQPRTNQAAASAKRDAYSAATRSDWVMMPAKRCS